MSEPILEARFEYKRYPCVVLFMPMAFRCGYVGLPRNSKYYGRNYNSIPVSCHGGLTYADGNLHGQDDNFWWIGFDCGHYADGFDVEKFNEYYKDDEQLLNRTKNIINHWLTANKDCEVRTLEYVENECKEIVDQLLKEEQ